MHLIYLI